MTHATSVPQFSLRLLGAFRLVAPSGERIELASKKGMALIAALAMAADGERARGWLHEKLWGSRDQVQARGSLRRELSNLRKCLNGKAAHLLVCEHDRVKLDLRYLRVDARTPNAASSASAGEFLEGLDITGEEGFEDWLREQRRRFTRERTTEIATQPANEGAPGEHPRVTICVLPFANMSGDPEQEYFVNGVTEDIITDLSKVSSLSVISRNTSFSFKGKQVDAAEVARELKASYVLEGSVRKVGNRVRISAQLIDGAHDMQVWAERYDRDLSDIFSMQDEISHAIVDALRLTLLPEEKKALEARATTNATAYGLYLMARQYNRTGNERHQDIVQRLSRRALDLDPNYSSAWAILSNCLVEMHRRSASDDDGWEAAERALKLDPNLAEAHAARGAVLCVRGLYDEGLVACKRALDLDPDSYEANKHAGRCCLATRRFADAIRYFEQAAAVMPSDFYALGMTLQAHEALGDRAGEQNAARRTLERVEKIIAQEPDHGRAIGFGVYALTSLRERERAKEWAERAMLLDPDNSNMKYNIACAMVKLGEADMALDTLENAASVFSPGLVAWIDKDRDFDPIREHPRFRAILKKVSARLSAPAASAA